MRVQKIMYLHGEAAKYMLNNKNHTPHKKYNYNLF
jgi:hypothetical protein